MFSVGVESHSVDERVVLVDSGQALQAVEGRPIFLLAVHEADVLDGSVVQANQNLQRGGHTQINKLKLSVKLEKPNMD